MKARTAKIRKILKRTYPDVKTQLRYRNAFELLIATILSAQCTDKQVNGVTKDLFKKLKTPDDFARTSQKTVEKLIVIQSTIRAVILVFFVSPLPSV